MDVDAYSYAQRGAWDRLDYLAGRRKLTGAEADELVALYRRTSQQLARLQSHSPDPELIAGLSALLTKARGRVLGTKGDAWHEVGRFFTHRFPATLYRAWPWWVAVAAVFIIVSTGLAVWISGSGAARDLFGVTDDNDWLTAPGGEFETYYSEHRHDAFAAQVWTNNAWVTAMVLFTGVLILPAVYLLFGNALNTAVTGGLMADAGRLDSFFGFILPHGTLELTAIFVAGGVGLKLGWTLIDPGRSSRLEAVARQGRATATVALGLVAVLLVCGLLEGFVTPSSLPVPVKVGIGFVAEALFLGYVFVVGRGAALEQDARAELGLPASGMDAAGRWQTTPSTR